MAVTKSWEIATAARVEHAARKPVERRHELVWLAIASLFAFCGLFFVFAAKTRDFAQEQARIDRGELRNLNRIDRAGELIPALQMIPDPAERGSVAERMIAYVEELRSRGPIPNVGALSRLRANSQPLVRLAKLKPLLVVRTPGEFTRTYFTSTLSFVLAFWLVHFVWRMRRFRGDPAILPALLMLSTVGLILMVSLRDPLRDTLEFKKFAWGVIGGCALLLLPLFRLFQYRNFSRLVYTPLLAALALFVGLIALGRGPTGSDAKVNLGPFQPVEIIKLLLVFFIAGYMTQNWERLRDLRPRGPMPRLFRWLRIARAFRWLELPRPAHALPVMCAVSCALVLFFALKDLGPALVVGFLLLTLFAVARGRLGLAALGVVILIAGVTIGYRLGVPHTVVERVSMWLSPWNNNIRGGDQLAHALWAFATGGPWGSGPGLGDPSVIPAGHTDLVLPSIAEEWGFPGVLAVAGLFVLLIGRAFRIAVRAQDEYGMFLAVGFGTLLALEMLLISGGALGAIPLSGVVSPFLSSGNTAMLANFFIFAILLGISNQSAGAGEDLDAVDENRESVHVIFKTPVRVAGIALALCCAALVARAFSIQVLHDRELLARDAQVIAHDGVKRPEHNPRLNLLAASIPRGDIFDRNGIPLATSNWEHLERHRADYERLGISIDQACSRLDTRLYPFGPMTEHLLGDLRTGEKFHATNASLIEHDSNTRLQGYRDYGELAGVVRYRHHRGNAALEALMRRDRDVSSTVDIRLQLKVNEILREGLGAAGKKGAAVVLNPANGDVLALASWPQPQANVPPTPDELLDRARYGQYPPGSTFKLVTAIAALRLDPRATTRTFTCRGLGDGRVGTVIPGWRRPIRDDIEDHAHGTLDMARAITVSCNAYFAQLGVYAVGSKALMNTAGLLGMSVGDMPELKKMLPFAAYGQAAVVTTPFKMARVAATIATGGLMRAGRWVTDANNNRTAEPVQILSHDSAAFLQRAMRSVVTSGTARAAMNGIAIDVAGKTGTAQLDAGDPHSWFAGYAPYDAPVQNRIAFAVVVEHGGYGARFAAPIARQIVEAAAQLGIIMGNSSVN